MFLLFVFNLCFCIFILVFLMYKINFINRDIDTLYDNYQKFVESEILKLCHFYTKDNQENLKKNNNEVKKWNT